MIKLYVRSLLHYLFLKEKNIIMDEKKYTSLKDFAREKLSTSRLEAGREKLSTDEISNITLTMRDCDYVEYTDKRSGEFVTYPVIVFDEFPHGFYRGGTQLADLCMDILSCDSLYDELKRDGLKIVLSKSLTNEGKNFTKVMLVDF